MKKRLEKGTYGYMDRLKMQEWKKSALMLAIPVLVFLIGWAVMKTRLQVVTVIAVVGCLPGCNEVVHSPLWQADIILWIKNCMRKWKQREVIAWHFTKMCLPPMIKNYVVDCIIISGQRGAWYSSEEKTDAKAGGNSSDHHP